MMIANKAFSFSPLRSALSPPPAIIRASSSRLFSSTTPPPQQLNPNNNNFEVQSSRVGVWWDLWSCPVPEGVDMFQASRSIVGAVRANGMYGPVKISGFGHGGFELSAFTAQPLLGPTDFNKTTREGNFYSTSHESLVENLLFWVALIHPPAHLFIISNDARLTTTLHDLRKRNYNVLVATNENPSSGDLCLNSSIVWRWNDLVKGDKLIGTYLDQPPDLSLYGCYGVELESPFSAGEAWRSRMVVDTARKNRGAENFGQGDDEEKMRRIVSKQVKGGGFLDKVSRMWFGPPRKSN